MSQFQTIEHIEPHKISLLRADLNVPMMEGKVTDLTRLVRVMPTIKALQEKQVKIVILSHFGRPKGKVDLAFSLRPVAKELSNLLEEEVLFCEDCIGDKPKAMINSMQEGQILVLENTRFYEGETKNDLAFSQQLALLGDVFVSDAFSAAHRAHASTTGIAAHLPAFVGLLMEAELRALSKALEDPKKPLAALVGGSKISTKLELLNNLIHKTDLLVLGGGMANTFLAAKGFSIGRSLFEQDMLDTAQTIAQEAEKAGCFLLLPEDAVIAREIKEGIETQIVTIDHISEDQMILDLGPATCALIKDKIGNCKTLIWNGPLGVFEVPPFDKGTNEIAAHVVALTEQGSLLSVAGGGDTVAALAHAGVADKISYISTAGGAFLEWMEGKTLPGVAVLSKD